jgi:hypothetical protein
VYVRQVLLREWFSRIHFTDGLKSVAMSGMENSSQEKKTEDILIRE